MTTAVTCLLDTNAISDLMRASPRIENCMAATALALGATLVSRDSDFAAIDGLSVVALA